MAYFGSSSSESAFQKVEPRTIFLFVWVALCGIVLMIILKGGGITPESLPVAAEAAKIVVQQQPAVPLIEVLVAKAPIAVGQKLIPDLFVIEKRSVLGFEDRVLTQLDQIENTYAAIPVQPNAILLKDATSGSMPMNAVTAKIPEGYRAVTISVDAESGVEGWVRAGARVDVIWLSTIRGKQAVSTIVEDAEILSAERSADVTADAATKAIPGHVTILVSAKDAQRVQLAKTTGTLSLNLRGSAMKDNVVETNGTTLTLDGLLSKDGDQEKIDTSGWIQMNGKSYEVLVNGKLKQAEDNVISKDIYVKDARK